MTTNNEILERLQDIEKAVGEQLQMMKNETVMQRQQNEITALAVSEGITKLNALQPTLRKVVELSNKINKIMAEEDGYNGVIKASVAIREDLIEIKRIYDEINPRKVEILGKFFKDISDLTSVGGDWE
jgi:hypothetical protein